ncbi:DUF1499 domain-containing protein [Zhongshania guokunii]|uniref:DUF1499 domain-containing protein n=1 Tax=Zhongshania guokunii TaxID=641783 RepID=A0ABV3U1C8_9GAMM
MYKSIILLAASALSACSTAPMQNAANTQFGPCPSAPRCVSSLEVGSKHIAALTVNSAEQWQLLQETLLNMPRTKVVERQANYLHAVTHSAIMRYRDDIELRYQPNTNRAEVRSASYLGYYDFEVNRERVETLRKLFNAAKNN